MAGLLLGLVDMVINSDRRQTDRQKDGQIWVFVLTKQQTDRQKDGHIWAFVLTNQQTDRQKDEQTDYSNSNIDVKMLFFILSTR